MKEGEVGEVELRVLQSGHYFGEQVDYVRNLNGQSHEIFFTRFFPPKILLLVPLDMSWGRFDFFCLLPILK